MEIVEVKGKVFRKFITREKIDQVVNTLAGRINSDYAGENPLLIGVLNGAFIFAADLIRKMEIPCQISFVKYASYTGTQSSKKVTELIGLNEEIKGRHILVVEDIVDSGITMDHLLKELHKYRPLSVRLACFCLKPDAFVKDFSIDYLGMEIPNDFVVGYGLDYDGYGRNLPEIYKLEN
ncbi:MAG: hypoxanthine phosphoribosyltransferase [Bacteroidales bacterium]|nr:hypoxanthine phosphoribosyltransferase [Bacteroidota bacterium]MBL6949600.1 hypoxanthine phosphoribosyltransferase [Bacteroidales bacterium]